MADPSKTRALPETIAAIATGVGGGIGIVRLSGPRAESIVARLVRPWPKGRPPSHKLHFGRVVDPQSGAVVDEVLACVMRGPRTFTGEDMGELQGHGGGRVLERVLALALAEGARLAEPGEFTRRAFEAGRIDLTRAEAIAELIAARSERALKAAQALSSGALEREVRALRGAVVNALAELEGGLDFPDERLDVRPEAESARLVRGLEARFRELAGSYRRFVHERAEVALLGRVNAGKSSLLNALAGEERALVDASAGTTRDLVEAEVEVGGLLLRLVDTAGLRPGAGESGAGKPGAGESGASEPGAGASESGASSAGGEPSELELRGIELARKRRGRADLALLVVDATVGFAGVEQALWDELGAQPRLIVWNKRDLGGSARGLPSGAQVIETAAPTGEGLGALRAALVRALGESEEAGGALHVGARHQEALLAGAGSLGRAAAALELEEPSEVAAVELRDALHHLGRITGETVDAEVLDAIFSRFCIGK